MRQCITSASVLRARASAPATPLKRSPGTRKPLVVAHGAHDGGDGGLQGLWVVLLDEVEQAIRTRFDCPALREQRRRTPFVVKAWVCRSCDSWEQRRSGTARPRRGEGCLGRPGRPTESTPKTSEEGFLPRQPEFLCRTSISRTPGLRKARARTVRGIRDFGVELRKQAEALRTGERGQSLCRLIARHHLQAHDYLASQLQYGLSRRAGRLLRLRTSPSGCEHRR